MTSCPPLATSSSDKIGKEVLYLSPVNGLIEFGPVDPKQLPRELTQIIKNLSVSRGNPDPIISSHQPLVESSDDDDAWAEGDKPVNIRIAFSPLFFNSPHVSYAIDGDSRYPPRCILNFP